MTQKTVLLVDDEQMFLEPLEDALVHEGHRVLKARDVTTALEMLEKHRIDLISIDVMLPPGPALEGKVSSQSAGLYLCERVSRLYPTVDAFCLSVVTNPETIRRIQRLGIPFLKKGETPLRKVLDLMRSRLTGVAFSSERDRDRDRY